MIEFRKNDDPESKRDSLLFVDGVFIEGANVRTSDEDPYCVITTTDYYSSSQLAKHSLSEFPIPPAQLFFNFYPDYIVHLDKPSGLFIDQSFKNQKGTNEFLVYLSLGGGVLSEWQSAYTFSDYAYEMAKIFQLRRDVQELSLAGINRQLFFVERNVDGNIVRQSELDLNKIIKSRIHSIEIAIPYSSPDITIADELLRISKIIQEVHQEVVGLLTVSNNSESTSKMEIRKKEGSDKAEYQLFVNGSIVEAADISGYGEHIKEGPFFGISFENYRTLKGLADCRFSDLPKGVSSITVQLESRLTSMSNLVMSEEFIWIHVPSEADLMRMREDRRFKFPNDNVIEFPFFINVSGWVGQSSPREFVDKIDAAFSDNPDIYIYFHEHDEYGFNISFRISSLNSRIVDEVLLCTIVVRETLDTVENQLLASPTQNSIIRRFNFHEDVAISCEQYLQYFIQFLRDLGVEATSELKHEAGKVLFTVTPTNAREALDKIRSALDVYLELPFSPVSDDMSNEIAVQRLESSVLRLKSDLKLAAAELQAKNQTIEAQQLIINVQKGLLSSEVTLGFIKNVMPKESEDREELFGGIAALTVYKKGGAEISLAKLYRHLKEWISKKE